LGWLIAAIAFAIAACILFILTQDIRLPMVWMDRWTIVHAIIAVVELISIWMVFKRKKKDKDEDKNQEPQQGELATA
jgi:membrane protein implicated in regulation of membrane protease activity